MFADKFYTPGGRIVDVVSNAATLFSDDFGGSAVDLTKWTVLNGGQGAVTLAGGPQAAIGTGTTGITDSVASSALTVAMNTTNQAERWYLSNQVFDGAEDILVILSKSQNLTANSIFIGLVEVGPDNIPLLNPNLANDFTNRGGVEFGKTVTTTAFQCEAVADSSGSAAVGSIGVAAVLTGTQEFVTEVHAEDIICSPQAVDSVAGKLAGASRVSTQCPSDNKKYKLVMRFKNVTAPGSNTNVVIQRIVVLTRQEMRVEVASGRGDFNAQKAIAVNVTNNAALVAGSAAIGLVAVKPTTSSGASTVARLPSAANTTNATLVASGAHTLIGGTLYNPTTADVYLKIFNKATAPVPGTDTPLLTITVPGASVALNSPPVQLNDILGAIGLSCSLGLGYAITNLPADNDSTIVPAGSVVGMSLIYI